MASVRVPFVVYYILVGVTILFSLLTWALAWAAVGRINDVSSYYYFDGLDRGTIAVSALMAIIAMVVTGVAVFDLVQTVQKRNQFGAHALTHGRLLTLLILTALLFLFIIICGAVSGSSIWINAGVVGAYIAFAVLTFVCTALWTAALFLGAFEETSSSSDASASAPAPAVTPTPQAHDPEMAAVAPTAAPAVGSEDPHKE